MFIRTTGLISHCSSDDCFLMKIEGEVEKILMTIIIITNSNALL